MPHDPDHAEDEMDGPPPGLSHAGAIVDQAIGYMTGQNIDGVSIASALLGGAIGMLTRSLDDESVVSILRSAIESVKAGEFREPASATPS
jgi:hypothetical protein